MGKIYRTAQIYVATHHAIPYTPGQQIIIRFQPRQEPNHAANTAIDSVIEHANETTKAAGERVREFAQIGVRKATEGFEQINKAAQTASSELNTQLVQARDGATRISLKALEVARKMPTRASPRCATWSPPRRRFEAFDISASTGAAAWRPASRRPRISAPTCRAADDAVRPVQERIEKFTKAAA